MPGDLAYKLAQHAKRTISLPHLPPYQTELTRALTHETLSLDQAITTLLSASTSTPSPSSNPPSGDLPPATFDPTASPATATALLVHHLSMRRNKRCLLAYHRLRCARLEDLCWRNALGGRSALPGGAGGSAPPGGDERVEDEEGEDGKEGTSPEEEEYARRYGELVAALKGRWMDVDLGGSLEPPRDLFVDVRVLRDGGVVEGEYGAITLTKNSQFHVRQGDVERLIAQGYLQRLS